MGLVEKTHQIFIQTRAKTPYVVTIDSQATMRVYMFQTTWRGDVGMDIMVALECKNAPFVLCMALLYGSITSPLKRSLDVFTPVVSRIMLPKINLKSVLMGKCVASPSSK